MSVLLDEETVILEALDFDVPCMAGPHAAEVSVECRFCSDQGFMCRAHWELRRTRVDEYLAAHPWGVLVCASCKAKAFTLGDLVRVVTL